MPNYCDNNLSLVGDVNVIGKFIKTYMPNDKITFDIITPEPKTKIECPKKYIVKDCKSDEKEEWFDWFNWRLEYWGTKWNSCVSILNRDTEYKGDKAKVDIYFSTAWSPALPIVKKLILNNPDIRFEYTYYEPGGLLGGGISHDMYEYNEYSIDESELHNWAIDNGFDTEEC